VRLPTIGDGGPGLCAWSRPWLPGNYELILPSDRAPRLDVASIMTQDSSSVREQFEHDSFFVLSGFCSAQAIAMLLFEIELWFDSDARDRAGTNRSERPRTQVNWRARPATAPENLWHQPVFRTGRWDFAQAGS
jgi:hypothetical protein